MFAVRASIETGEILSAVDEGPRPGDDGWVKAVAELIFEQMLADEAARKGVAS